MNEELKPCPFCGGEATICEAKECGPQAYVVSCKKCLCSSRVIFALMDDVTADLTSAWNIRAALDMLDPAELIRKAVNEKLDEAYRKARSMHPSKLTEHGNYGYVLAREEIADAILAMKEEG